MKLADTKFKVMFNEHFKKLFDIENDQIAWLVRETAKMMTTDKWDSNVNAQLMDEELDCWQHDALLPNGKTVTIEGVPYPKDCLILWVPQYYETLPQPERPETTQLEYPKDFEPYLNVDRKNLGIFKIGEEV